jgi:phosphatidylglycerophosphatase A
MNWRDMCLTLGPVGHLRPAPGTWGSLAALPMAWGLGTLAGWMGLMIASGIVFALGSWLAQNQGDRAEIVIDEVAGQWLACISVVALGGDWWAWALAFVLFRLFDIWKPGPIGWMDQTVKGGIGIMLDDVAAGIVAGLGVAATLIWMK